MYDHVARCLIQGKNCNYTTCVMEEVVHSKDDRLCIETRECTELVNNLKLHIYDELKISHLLDLYFAFVLILCICNISKVQIHFQPHNTALCGYVFIIVSI